ncbi:MAG: type II toxin-antitoxin system VapC family toxin [Armatimonadota bacterium]
MSGTLVDSNVIIDILTDDPTWSAWSAAALERCADQGVLYINPIIYAETSLRFITIEECEAALPETTFRRLPLPMEAAFLAGKAYLRYRQQGGLRTATLPDFFIGAHAAVANLRLLTRDAARYHTYFPTVSLIAPRTS